MHSRTCASWVPKEGYRARYSVSPAAPTASHACSLYYPMLHTVLYYPMGPGLRPCRSRLTLGLCGLSADSGGLDGALGLNARDGTQEEVEEEAAEVEADARGMVVSERELSAPPLPPPPRRRALSGLPPTSDGAGMLDPSAVHTSVVRADPVVVPSLPPPPTRSTSSAAHDRVGHDLVRSSPLTSRDEPTRLRSRPTRPSAFSSAANIRCTWRRTNRNQLYAPPRSSAPFAARAPKPLRTTWPTRRPHCRTCGQLGYTHTHTHTR